MRPKAPKTFRMYAIHRGGAVRFRRESRHAKGVRILVGPLVYASREDADLERRPGEDVVEVLCVPQTPRSRP